MLSEEVVHFFERQSFTIASTIDAQGRIHNACKGVVSIDASGRIYLLDLYHGRTYANLKKNPCISLTGVDEHRFKGYCLKGRARIENTTELSEKVIAAWEEKLTTRITQRVIDSIQGRKGHKQHPEALLPNPKYLVAMDVDEVIDLTPAHIHKEEKG